MDTDASQRMSRVDTAWLRMDSEVNLMMIVGVWLLDEAIPLAALRDRVGQRLLQYPRFGQRAVQDAQGAAWVDDPAFDICAHVVAEPLHRARGQSARAALQQRCGELLAQPLNPDRPLWQFHWVSAYEGGCAVIVRIHHCIADGMALIAVMNSLADADADAGADADASQGPPPAAGIAGSPPAQEGDWLLDAVLRPLHGLNLARAGLHVLGDLAALAWMADDSPTRLKGRPGGHKRVAWGEPIPLAQVKAVGRVLGCSVNDVLLACVSGAIGHWLRTQGDEPGGAEIRAMVPVNLRPLGQAWQLGNRFGLAPLMLPVGIANPVARVYAVRARMDQLKGSFQPLLSFGMLAATGLLSKPMQDRVLGLFSHKTTAVMTNVPGPATPLRLCGATVRQMLFWVPASGDVGVGVSILSYAGGVQFGLITDVALCPDPQAIIDRFGPEFEQLLWLSLMLPWGQPDASDALAGQRG